jgi:hypothetical protein
MRKSIVNGTSTEEKFAQVDRILQSHGRRLHKTIIGVIPPMIVSEYVKIPEPDGVILRRICPTEGTITKAAIAIDAYIDKTPVTFDIRVESPAGGAHFNMLTRKLMFVFKPELPVVPGTKLILSVDKPLNISGIWIGYLYDIGLADMTKQKFLIEDFEKLIDASKEVEDAAEGA